LLDLQREIVSLNQLQELPHLIWLCFTFDLLKVDKFINGGVNIDVMTPRNSIQAESEGFHETAHVFKPGICRRGASAAASAFSSAFDLQS